MTTAQRPLLPLLLDAALLGAMLGSMAALVYQLATEDCDCPHCLERARLKLQAAELREHLDDIARAAAREDVHVEVLDAALPLEKA